MRVFKQTRCREDEISSNEFDGKSTRALEISSSRRVILNKCGLLEMSYSDLKVFIIGDETGAQQLQHENAHCNFDNSVEDSSGTVVKVEYSSDSSTITKLTNESKLYEHLSAIWIKLNYRIFRNFR